MDDMDEWAMNGSRQPLRSAMKGIDQQSKPRETESEGPIDTAGPRPLKEGQCHLGITSTWPAMKDDDGRKPKELGWRAANCSDR